MSEKNKKRILEAARPLASLYLERFAEPRTPSCNSKRVEAMLAQL